MTYLLILLCLAALWCAGWWATRLPEKPAMDTTPSPEPRDDTQAARLWTKPGTTGLMPLPDGIEAFGARLKLIDMAEDRIDVQYYLWRADSCGDLMFEALMRAADRGVRVRILLDDNATKPLTHRIAWADSHDNVEIRLFNPFALRFPRLLGYAMDFRRLNRRMHNKALIVDGRAAVLGGRNIGNEYYNDMSDLGLFMDFDVIVAGQAARDAQTEFDSYWNSEPSWPASALLSEKLYRDCARGEKECRNVLDSDGTIRFSGLITDSPTVIELEAGRIKLHEAKVTVVFDPPEKVLGRARRRHLLFPTIHSAMGTPKSEFDIISPYFVPRSSGRRQLVKLAKQGVKIRVLTNSLASSDQPIVHSGYARHRHPLLRAGAEIYEFARDEKVRFRRGLIGRRRRGTSPFARTKLHAKLLAVDKEKVFVGTFNFDPRSLFLNTEMGVVVEDPEWAADLYKAFDEVIPGAAWKLSIPHHRLHWHSSDPAKGQREWTHEPYTTWWQRSVIKAGSWLPIEWLL